MSNKSQSTQLAIIIPYYKDRYIESTLLSIQQQTNQQFILYIGDDNSPHPLYNIIGSLANDFKERIVYKRFDENLGAISLTRQWERCIDLSVNEPWIWLFSDDDIMPVDAVERFYKEISNNKATDNLLRFNIQIINDFDTIISGYVENIPFETARNFLFRRLNWDCISTACEYIFSREIYQKKEGFVEFPLAWCSDDATWASFAEENGIKTIPGLPVSWRFGGYNISSDQTNTYKLKIDASILFLKFIESKYTFDDELKWKMLIGQLSLLQNSKKVKFYFYTQIYKSNIFKRSFFVKKIYNRYVDYIKKVINN